MDYKELLELAKKRRSIRRFKSDPLPDDYVEKIIEVARWAPSGFNSQPWDFVVVKKEKLRKKIVDIITSSHSKEGVERSTESNPSSALEKLERMTKFKPEAFVNAPVFIILYGDTRARVALPQGLIKGPKEHYLHILNASLANAFIYMHLAATSLGLAAHWWSMVAFEPAHSDIKALLGIPQQLIAFDMIVLGYPDAVPRPKLLRPKEKMVHYDDCGVDDFRTAKEIDDFGRRTKAWTLGQHRREQFRSRS
jgi:nitroreductase